MWVEEAETGVGGLAGMKNEGTLATVPMIATYRVMLGISLAFVARNGQMS